MDKARWKLKEILRKNDNIRDIYLKIDIYVMREMKNRLTLVILRMDLP